MEDKIGDSEFIIALIGLVGVVVTAVLSNWDKLFGKKPKVQAAYSGYRPTGDFETELRYYFDVSGTRRTMESMQDQVLLNAKMELISKEPSDAAEIEKVFEAIKDEAIRVDDVIAEMTPIYKEHFTVEEMQELNKFYSTDVMQKMSHKYPLLVQDAAPILVRMQNDFECRLEARLEKTKGRQLQDG